MATYTAFGDGTPEVEAVRWDPPYVAVKIGGLRVHMPPDEADTLAAALTEGAAQARAMGEGERG